ncbi:HAD-IIA family hydrolase [Cohnella lubricantis]|uniref:Acid sugar phosphatase n=1 Tax=Cohnella lubricantis TaxID=2163172 RepID=A0A841TAZ5_9BACL|nr:HAD-IIA family hydrolase [Cohnella lubricantis]MBB6676197.1 HAD-IIA family hydrolase [Cohnella lubricantis]MBP2118610.1 4-nitrophenyl phosphatase [Cohnella lubricantis]
MNESQALHQARSRPKAILFDLDGTLYRGDEPVPGADKLIAGLVARGIACWYITNNSTRTPAQVAEHLHRMNIPAVPEQVITSAEGAAAYAKQHYGRADAFVLGEHGLQEAMSEAGFRLAEEGPAQVVVQGLDRTLTYDRMTRAVHHLLSGAVYLLTNPDLRLPVADGVLPGAGSIAAALQAASGVQPTVIGKPSSILMNFALERAGVAPEDAWVVGDNPNTDIAAGLAVGCQTVLVLTGLCTEADWRSRCEAAGAMPDKVCRDPQELSSWIEQIDSQLEHESKG